MFLRQSAVCPLAIGLAMFLAECYAVPQSSSSSLTQIPNTAAVSRIVPQHSYNSRHMGSAYVPLDSWIYPALDRLAALGYAERGFEGMRPWTRIDCARMVDQAKETQKVFHPLSEDAEDLLGLLEAEFSFEMGLRKGQRNLNAGLESAYARVVSISGPDLSDGYHFGQTVSYDFGRPFERGTNGQVGADFHAEAGPFAVYVRGEYQHAPSAPAPSQAVLNVITLKDEVPTPADIGIGGINRPRLLDTYIVMKLSPLKLDKWQLSVGRQSHSWGPGPGAFLLSNNAEPVDMVEVVNPEPVRLPFIFKFLGPVRVDQFLGRLANRTDHANPWIYAHKISFRPLSCLEIGYARLTTIGGSGGNPFTIQNFFLSYFGQVSHKLNSVPGENNNEMDWTFYVPKTRNYIVLYGEVYAFDDFVAWVRPTAYPFRPGIYITRIPGIPRLDLHIEAANTQAPGWNSSGGGNQGQVVYWNSSYHEGNTNNGFLLGNTVGRDGQTIQGWLTYWTSPRNTFQVMYKNNFVDPAFIPGGGAWQDYSVQNELHRRSGFFVKSQLQYEHISHYPILFKGPQQNLTAIVELGFMPANKKHEH
jgi:hypothetical protein